MDKKGKRYLRTGDVVFSPEANSTDRYIVFGLQIGSIACIWDKDGEEALGLPGTPAEGLEGLIPLGEHWDVDRTIAAFGRAGIAGTEIIDMIHERYDEPPYEINE